MTSSAAAVPPAPGSSNRPQESPRLSSLFRLWSSSAAPQAPAPATFRARSTSEPQLASSPSHVRRPSFSRRLSDLMHAPRSSSHNAQHPQAGGSMAAVGAAAAGLFPRARRFSGGAPVLPYDSKAALAKGAPLPGMDELALPPPPPLPPHEGACCICLSVGVGRCRRHPG
jgi:hypothetical protein